MIRLVSLVPICLLMLSGVTAPTASYAASVLKSSKPIYARAAVTQDGLKVLNLALDESKGTGKGYDTLYLDTNFNGRFETSEKVSGQANGFGDVSFAHFEPAKIPTRFSSKATEPSRVGASYAKIQGEESFNVMLNFSMRQGSETWQYMLIADAKPSSDLSKAPVLKFNQAPKLSIETKPDPAQKGNTGIGINVSLGEAEMMCRVNRRSPQATVAVKNASGKIIKKDTGTIDKFGFG